MTNEWISVKYRLPETVLLNSTTAISGHYLVYIPGEGQSYGYMIRYLESNEPYWFLGDSTKEAHPSHWLEISDPK